MTPQDIHRFWEKVPTGEIGCWNWQSAKRSDGYGVFRIAGHTRRASRLSYELAKGPIPPNAFVLHSCDNPSCVRPSHLRIGSHHDNMADMVARERHSLAKTESCINGHPFTGENLFHRSDGGRGCRICRRDNKRRSRAKKSLV